MMAMTTFHTRLARSFKGTAILALLLAVGVLASADVGLTIPEDFQHWYLANSMLVTKPQNPFGLIPGIHLIYVNPGGFDRFESGGSAPYPDGTVFVDDIRDFSPVDGAYQQGGRKVVAVMVKDSQKYASTGGWGFQAWPGGDLAKPIVNDPQKQCFACHMARKANGYVFSTDLH
jgi:hypothetical protein